MDTLQAQCPRCGANLCATGEGPGVCPRCELAATVGEPTNLPLKGELGPYLLESLLAHGAIGAVYRARHKVNGQSVALKTLLAGRLASKEMRERFFREAKLSVRLRHPNVVPVLDVGEADGLAFIAMELLPGRNLADLAREAPVQPFEAAKLLHKISQAVAAAHELGIVHRDLKPSNVLFDEMGEPRVADFGAATSTDELLPQLTLTGQVVGSPAYMPPERVGKATGVDENATARAGDIYSLGATLYHLLAGRPPFQGASLDAVLLQVARDDPIRLSKLNPSVPPALEAICLKCLEKNPVSRYADAQALAADLQRFIYGGKVRARLPGVVTRTGRWIRRNPTTASLCAAALLLLLVVLIGSPLALLRINRERLRARQSAAAETRLRQNAEALALREESHLYAARINLAFQSFEEGEVSRARSLLEELKLRTMVPEKRGFEWGYVWRLAQGEERVFTGHQGFVRTVAFAPDGNSIASAGDDCVIRIWNPLTGESLRKMVGHTGAVTCVRFSPDGTALASASADRTVRLWALTNDSNVVLWRDKYTLGALALSKDGQFLAAGSAQPARGEPGPGQRYLPAPDLVHHLTIWDLPNRKLLKDIATNMYGTLCLDFSPDGRTLVAGSRSKRVNFLNTASFEVTVALTNPIPMSCMGLEFSRDSKHVATVSWNPTYSDGEVKFLDPKTGAELPFRIFHPGPVTCLAHSPDGKTLATGGADHLVKLWDATTGDLRAKFAGHTEAVWCLAWSPDGKQLASASWDGTVRIWNPQRQQEADVITTKANFSAAFSRDGKLAVIGGRGVEIRDANSGDLLTTLPQARTNDTRVAFSPDGSQLAAAGFDRMLQFYRASDWNLEGEVGAGPAEIRALVYSPDGRTVAISAMDGSVQLFDTATRTRQSRFETDSSEEIDLVFLPDGNLLSSGNALRKWDIRSGKALDSRPLIAGKLCLSPDGTRVAVSGRRGSIKILDTVSLNELMILDDHKDEISDLAFSPDGQTLASAGWDGAIKLWHMRSGELLLTLKSTYALVRTVVFSPDGNILLYGSGSPNSRGGEIAFLRTGVP